MTFMVAQVFAQQEARTADRLHAIGFEIFFPRLKQLVVRRGRRCIKIEPVFPCYLIVKQNADADQVHEINETKGVIHVLMTADNTPAKIRDHEIASIKSECTRDDFIITPKHQSAFLPGERVRPKSGPFVDHVGTFRSMTSKNRVSVLFNLFGREAVVTLRVGDLVAA